MSKVSRRMVSLHLNFALAALIAFVGLRTFAATYYVTPDAAGSGDGQSWASPTSA